MVTQNNPNHNHLLAALPRAEFERLSHRLELVHLPLGMILFESGSKLHHAYFSTTAIVSLHYVMENGATAGIAEVGNEGMLGVSLFMGGVAPPCVAFVMTAGYAYRLKAKFLMEEFNLGGAMQHLLFRYTQALITQASQTAACNRHHSVEQQLCRWLLLTLDRQATNELILTQELVANMIGVRREGVTEAAGRLQHAGLISYRRGHITVLDRTGLEHYSCECYGVVKREFDRLLDRNWKPVPAPDPAARNYFAPKIGARNWSGATTSV